MVQMIFSVKCQVEGPGVDKAKRKMKLLLHVQPQKNKYLWADFEQTLSVQKS